MSRAHRPLAAALLAALALALGSLRAAEREGERVTLRWKAPAECPGESDVKAEVDRLLGASRARPAKPIEVTAAVSRDEQGTWHVRLETPGDGATRVREIHGASCHAIANASALILAMMIDPEAAAAAPAPSSSAAATSSSAASANAPGNSPSASTAPSGTSPSAAASAVSPGAATTGPFTGAGSMPTAPGAPVQVTAPPATPKKNKPPGTTAPPPEIRMLLPISFRIGAWAGADAGSLPGVSAGFGVTGALLIGAQRIEVGFAARPPATGTLAARPTAGGSVDLISGSIGTCRALLERPVQLGPCLSLEAGRMHAAGFGVTAPGHADEPWVAAGAGGLLSWAPVRRVALVLRIDAVAPLLRPTFVLDGVGPVHRPDAVAGRAAGGVELVF
jgi:hypothetical protein